MTPTYYARIRVWNTRPRVACSPPLSLTYSVRRWGAASATRGAPHLLLDLALHLRGVHLLAGRGHD